MYLTIMIFLSLMISLFMMIMNFILSKKFYKNREKSSPFECGYDIFNMNRLPFSLQFYLISIIFLIFDVEISIILPIIVSNNYSMMNVYINFMLIFFILLIGLFLEWYEGALKWFKFK